MADITGTAGSDTLDGTAGADTISGLDGFDRIDGKAGDDVINGGLGNDTIQGGTGDDVIDGGDGDDSISDDGGSDTLRGGAGNDSIRVGRNGATSPELVRVEAGIGNDSLSYQNYRSGSLVADMGDGDDSVDLIVMQDGGMRLTLGAGRDTISFNQLLNSSDRGTLTVTDFAAGAAGDKLDFAEWLNKTLINWDGSANPFGAAGYLRLVQQGASTLLQIDRDGTQGGTYGHGFNTLVTFENNTAGAFTAENFGGLPPVGRYGTSGDDILSGTAVEDILFGYEGYDLLLGNGGADQLYGGRDSDTYVIDDAGDRVYENVGEGYGDSINSSVSYILAAGVEVERMLATSAAINLTGNDFGQMILGGDGINILSGLGGDDVLSGGAGDDALYGGDGWDILDGEAGADFMAGGADDDLYYVDHAGDVVVEAQDAGRDDVSTALSYTLPDHVERLFLTGSGDLTGRGNAQNNYLSGTDGANLLVGEAGDDEIKGRGGDDVLLGGTGQDILYGESGDDRLEGGSGLDTAVFAGARAAYTTARLTDGRLRVSGPDGTDTLSGVERFGFDDGVYRPADTLFSASPVLGVRSFGASDAAGGWVSDDRYPRTAADINGDGRADLIGFGAAGVYASLSRADGSFGPVHLAQSSFGASDAGGGWTSADTYPRVAADVNGDGMADLIGFGSAGAYVSLATGEGRFGEVRLAVRSFGASDGAGGWTSADRFPRAAADINGDGRADLIGFGAAGVYASLSRADGSFGPVYLAQSSFGAAAEAGGWASDDAYPRALGDVNGDGMADLVGFGAPGVYVSLATGEGRFGEVRLAVRSFGTSDAAGGWTSDDRFPRLAADVNGDGLADIVGFGAAGAYVSLGQEDGSFADPTLEVASFGSSDAAGGWASDDRFPRLAADVNGDGLADIVGFGAAGAYFSYGTDLVPM